MPSALAIAAHPDDIEFMMAGTLLLLKEAGWETHYINVSTGNMGSTVMSAAQTARVRRKEAQAAAKKLGAKWYAPFCDDMSIFYTEENIRRLSAVVRESRPSVVLTHPVADYMEDHMIVARLAVTAAFTRGIPNFRSLPQRTPSFTPCVIYHAMPVGLCSPLREAVAPEMLTSIPVASTRRSARHSPATPRKRSGSTNRKGRTAICRRWTGSRSRWGKRAKKFTYAEGWTRHLHYGFGAEEDDPLRDVLGKKYLRNSQYP